MKIQLVAVGRTSTPFVVEGIGAFLKRLGHYVKVETTIIPDVKATRGMTPEAQKEKEGQAILSLLAPGDCAVLLDERGREYTSREFAGFIDGCMTRGFKRLVFIVGGPYGFSPEVYDRVKERISLSRMTFTHEMVRLFFVEQIYRAMTILRGEPYHHD